MIRAIICLAVNSAWLTAQPNTVAPFAPQIPRVWQQTALEQLDVPVSHPEYSPRHVTEDYYYRIPAAAIYKSYPVYAAGRAPAGYIEKLKRLAPELAFNPAKLKTREDWIRAGEIVFDAATSYGTEVSIENLADPEWYAATRVPIARDGAVPWGTLCHSRHRERGGGESLLRLLSHAGAG